MRSQSNEEPAEAHGEAAQQDGSLWTNGGTEVATQNTAHQLAQAHTACQTGGQFLCLMFYLFT